MIEGHFFNDKLKKLVLEMLNPKPTLRFSAEQALKMYTHILPEDLVGEYQEPSA